MSEADISPAQGWEFQLAEMGWFNRLGEMNATLTALSTLASDAQFESWISSIRAARAIAKGEGITQAEVPESH